MIHSANYQLLPANADKSLFEELGFGRPALLDEILYNDPNEFTMVWHLVFQDGVDLQIQDIPFPSSLVEDGHFTGEVTVTLVTSASPHSGAQAPTNGPLSAGKIICLLKNIMSIFRI